MEEKKETIQRETGIYGRGAEPISYLTEYRIGGQKRYVSDKPVGETRVFLTINDAVNDARSLIGLGKEQRLAAIDLFRKQRPVVMGMITSSHDYALVARVLLFVAGRNMGKQQSINRFIPKGRGRVFLKFSKKLGGTSSKPRAEVSIMANANEFLSGKDLPTLSREQVNDALATNKVVKIPEAWVIIYEFARRNFARNETRWSNHEFGVTQAALASWFSLSIQGVRVLFNDAQVIFGRSHKWNQASQRKPAAEEENRAKANQVLAKLGLQALDTGQARAAMAMMPNVDRPDAWVILYHFAFGTYSFSTAKGSVTKVMLAKALAMPLMTVKNLYNQAQARLGKTTRWKTFTP